MREEGARLHVEAREWAASWSQRWFLDDDGSDRFRIGGLDAGWATHVEAYLLLLDLALEHLGIADRSRRPSPLRWLKTHGYDRAVRAAGLRLSRKSRRPEPRELAVLIEIPTPSMLEPGALVAATAGDMCVMATADPRAMRRLERRGLRAHALVGTIADERRLITTAQHYLDGPWQQLASQPPSMPLRNADVGRAAVERLRPLVKRSMPYLLAESAALDAFLDAATPRALAMASDQHRMGRIAVQRATSRGIATIVLQHGLPQGPIGYLPVVADTVAAWAPSSVDWFREHGTERARLTMTGNPRMDELTDQRPSVPRTPHLLLGLTPTSSATNVAIVRSVLAALERLSTAQLTIKLHPGQSSWTPIERLVRASGNDRVTLRRHEPLYPLLKGATHVIVHRSTVAVEALAAHRPVIVIRAGPELTTADLELADLRLPVAASPGELVAAVNDLDGPVATAAYFAQREDAIAHVTGPIDGRSAARVVELLHAQHPTVRQAASLDPS